MNHSAKFQLHQWNHIGEHSTFSRPNFPNFFTAPVILIYNFFSITNLKIKQILTQDFLHLDYWKRITFGIYL